MYHGSPFPLAEQILKAGRIKSRGYFGPDGHKGDIPKIGGGTLDEFGLIYAAREPNIARYFAQAGELGSDSAKELGIERKGLVFQKHQTDLLKLIKRGAYLKPNEISKINEHLPEYKHLTETSSIGDAGCRLFMSSPEKDKKGLRFALDTLGYNGILQNDNRVVALAQDSLRFDKAFPHGAAGGLIPNYAVLGKTLTKRQYFDEFLGQSDYDGTDGFSAHRAIVRKRGIESTRDKVSFYEKQGQVVPETIQKELSDRLNARTQNVQNYLKFRNLRDKAVPNLEVNAGARKSYLERKKQFKTLGKTYSEKYQDVKKSGVLDTSVKEAEFKRFLLDLSRNSASVLGPRATSQLQQNFDYLFLYRKKLKI